MRATIVSSCGWFVLTFMAGLTLSPVARAQVQQAELLGGLNNPCGVAVQPGTGDVFVSDSAALRVVRVNPKKGGSAQEVIVGFPQDVYGKGPMYNIGPLGLAFLSAETLVVGDGGLPDGSELVRVYAVPAAGKSVKADDMKHKLGPIGPGDASLKGEGNYYGVAATSAAIFVTCNGDDTKGWVARSEIKGGAPGSFTPFIETKTATEVDAPVGITTHGNQLVVSQMGEMNVPQDSLLTMYDAQSGKLVAKGKTGLFDIAGVAYSTKSGKLYAVDFAWLDTKQGGLFELQVGGTAGEIEVKAVKVLELDKPTALAFDSDGALYVTLFGTAADGSTSKSGKLLKITGKL